MWLLGHQNWQRGQQKESDDNEKLSDFFAQIRLPRKVLDSN